MVEYENTIPFYPDPSSLESLSSATRLRVADAFNKLIAIYEANGTEFEVAKLAAYPAATRFNSDLRTHQKAAAAVTVFDESVGPQGTQASLLSDLGVAGLLVVCGLVEAYLGENGLRFALAQFGLLHQPWDDPLSLTASMVIGAVSAKSAHTAGTALSWSDDSVLHAPERAEIILPTAAPGAVLSDPTNHRYLLEGSTIAKLAVERAPQEPTDFLDDEQVPPSPEVAAEETAAAGAAAKEAEDAERKRFLAVLRMPRKPALSRRIGIAFVMVTLGLWAVNGVLRTGYIERLPAPAAGSTATGIFGATAAPHTPAGLSPVETGIAITLVSWFLYLLSVGVVYAHATPARRRGKELRQARDAAEKRIDQTVRMVEAAHREYLRRRGAIEKGKFVAVNEEANARIEGEHEGLVGLEGIEGLGGS